MNYLRPSVAASSPYHNDNPAIGNLIADLALNLMPEQRENGVPGHA
jgi:hypothetical protein